MYIIRNLTPHPIVLRRPDGTDLTIPCDPAGPCRVAQRPATLLHGYWSRHVVGEVLSDLDHGPVPVYQSGGWGPVEGLPASVAPGETLIVSLFAAQAARAEAAAIATARSLGRWLDGSAYAYSDEERTDHERREAVLGAVVAPGTGPDDGAIRGADGKVMAVTRLVRV